MADLVEDISIATIDIEHKLVFNDDNNLVAE